MSSTPHRRLAALLSALLGLGAIGCEVPASEQDLVAFPAQASMALRGDLQVRVSLGEDQLSAPPQVEVSGGGRTWRPACTLDVATQAAVCEPIADLPEGVDYELVATAADGSVLVQDISSAAPAQGEAWMLTDAPEVLRFGGNTDSRALLSLLLERSNIVGVLSDDHVLVGPVKSIDSAVRIQAPGLGFALPVTADDGGTFATAVMDGYLPLSVDGESAHAYVLDAQITGERQGDDLVYTLTGAFPASTVEELGSLVGVLGELAVAELAHDVDSNGDGVADAVSFSITGVAGGTTLKAWETEAPSQELEVGVAL